MFVSKCLLRRIASKTALDDGLVPLVGTPRNFRCERFVGMYEIRHKRKKTNEDGRVFQGAFKT